MRLFDDGVNGDDIEFRGGTFVRDNAFRRLNSFRRRDLVDLAGRLIEGAHHLVMDATGHGMIAGGVDRFDLRFKQRADASVRAGLAQAPCDLADHARAFARRRKHLLDGRSRDGGSGAVARGGEDGAHCGHRFGQFIRGRNGRDRCGHGLLLLVLLLGRQRLFETRDRFQHHGGVGVAVAPRVFVQKPAAARCLEKGLADSIKVRVRRRGGAGRNRRQCERLVGHENLLSATSV